jgi:broad-specificity NMP kinase
MDDVTGGWRELQNEQLHSFSYSPSITRIVRSSMIIWAWHVARKVELRSVYKFLKERLKGRNYLKDRVVDSEDNIKNELVVIGSGYVDRNKLT